MEMMLPCITTFFHASKQLVYPLFHSVKATNYSLNFSQEDNDQAFPVTL